MHTDISQRSSGAEDFAQSPLERAGHFLIDYKKIVDNFAPDSREVLELRRDLHSKIELLPSEQQEWVTKACAILDWCNGYATKALREFRIEYHTIVNEFGPKSPEVEKCRSQIDSLPHEQQAFARKLCGYYDRRYQLRRGANV